MVSKIRNNFIHTQRRLLQRYNIKINRQEYNQLCSQIKRGKSIFLGRQTPSRTVHQVKLKGFKIIVVYNTNIGNICTILYPGRSYRLV